jgi:hypothetical protein
VLSKHLYTCLLRLIPHLYRHLRAPIRICLIDFYICDFNHLKGLRVAVLKLVLFHNNAFVFLPVLTLMHVDADSLPLFLQFENIFTLLEVVDLDHIVVTVV